MSATPQVTESLLERGLEGKVKPEEFHKYLQDYISDFNAQHKKQTECATASDKYALDFNFNGGMVPVVDFEETGQHKDRTDTITITNNSKKKLYVELQYVPNPKFKMEITPPVAELSKKGGSATIEFRIRAFCTTKIYQLIRVSLSEKKKDTGKSGGLFSFGSKSKQPIAMNVYTAKQLLGPQDGEVGAFYFYFKVESELSPSIDYDEIMIPDDPKAVLGKGGFGTVYKASWRGAEVAVKRLNTEELVEEELTFVKREMHTMTRLSYSYVITTMGYTQVPGQPLSIIMEFVKGGSLTKLIQQPLDDRFKAKLALDCAKGLSFLHSAKIYHRDIKPDNLLVINRGNEADVNLKITDFGTSKAAARSVASYASRKELELMREMKEPKPSQKKLDTTPSPVTNQTERTMTKGVGTLIYSAPEILAGHTDVDFAKTDVYSFGVMLLQIFTGIEPYSQPPYDKYDKWKLEGFVTSGKRLPIPPSPIVPDKIKTLIEDCWAHNPNKRPDVNFIIKFLEDLMPTLSNVKPGTNNNVGPAVGPPSGGQYLGIDKVRTLSVGGSSPGPSSPLNASKVDNSIGEFLPEKTIFPTQGHVSQANHNLLPSEDPVDLGYCAEISREESAAKLNGQPDGTYLVRWSTKTDSFVLSFVKSGKDVQHIAFIKRNPKGEIVVDKQGGGTCTYANLNEYVASMKKTGVISAPILIGPASKPIVEDLYVLSHS